MSRDYVAEAVLAHLWNVFPRQVIRLESDRVVSCDGERLAMLPPNPEDGRPFDLPTLKYLFQSFDEQVRALPGRRAGHLLGCPATLPGHVIVVSEGGYAQKYVRECACRRAAG